MLKVKRKTYTMRLKEGLLDEAKSVGLDTKLVIEQALEQAILSLKTSKKATPIK